jgi:uncharacterized protein (DUF697 family)
MKEATAMSEREEQALATVKNYMWWAGGAGLIPVPLVDWAAVSGVQLKMLASISEIYGVPYRDNTGKAVVASLGGFIVPHALAFGWLGSLIKGIPVVGVLAGAPVMGLFSAASAWALGKVFIQHFESGGTFLNFDPEKVKTYYQEQFAVGQKMATDVGSEKKTEAVHHKAHA